MAKKKVSSDKDGKKKPVKKKKVSKKKVVSKKVTTKKKGVKRKRKPSRYHSYLTILSSWKKRNNINFKGINFHTIAGRLYEFIPKEEDIFPLSELTDEYLNVLFKKYSGIPLEKPLSEILPDAINYWNLENYLEPIIDSQIYIDNSLYGDEVDDYDGSAEQFVDEGYWSDMLRQLNSVIKGKFDNDAERYHWYIWNVDESGKIIFTLIYATELAEEQIKPSGTIVTPIAPTPTPVTPVTPPEDAEKQRQIELEREKQKTLEREIELEKEKQKTLQKQIELEREKSRVELTRAKIDLIKEMKQLGFSKKEIQEFLKDI